MSMPISIDELEKNCGSGEFVEINYKMKHLPHSSFAWGLDMLIERLKERKMKFSEITIINIEVCEYP
jgi:hypothetical protein